MKVATEEPRVRPWAWAGVAVVALSLASAVLPARAAEEEPAFPEARFTSRARAGVYRWTTEICFLFLCERKRHARRFTRYTTSLDVTVPNELVGADAWVEGMPFSVKATGGWANGTVTAADAPGRSVRARSARFRDPDRHMTLSVRWNADSMRVKFRRHAGSSGSPNLPETATAEVVLGQFSRAYAFALARGRGRATGTSTGTPLGTAPSDPGAVGSTE